jgi:transcriptional regulator with XRE-family HTH domain
MGGPARAREIDPIIAKLTSVRRARGVSQEALAESLHTQQSTISTWESGTNTPTLHSLRRLAGVLGYELAIVPRGAL